MAWAKLDDGLWCNEKLWSVSVHARWLYVAAISWSVDNLTDGYVPVHAAVYVSRSRRAPSWARELLAARLWSAVDGGYLIHDFHEYNDSAEQVKQRRKKWAGMKASARAARDKSAVESAVESADPVTVPSVSHSVSQSSTPVTRPREDDDGPCDKCRTAATTEAGHYSDIRNRARWINARARTLHADGACLPPPPRPTLEHIEPEDLLRIASARILASDL